ncbi:MAG: thioredoxin family protein [Bacteroidetes bacterium]|nr:thioredoxin family protein [Bacteroidota bacterium]
MKYLKTLRSIGKVTLLLLFCLVSTFSFAQILDPVKWTFTAVKVSGSEAELTFTAKIDKNWHLYSQKVTEDGPVPTSFHFETKKGVELIGKTEEPNVKAHFDKVFNADIKYFDGKAVFKQKVRIVSDKSPMIKGFLEFMACDDTKCLVPKEEDFEFTFKGYTATAATTNVKEAEKQPVTNTPANAVTGKDTAKPGKTAVTAQSKADSAQVSASKASPYEKISKSLWTLFFFSFLAGLAAILTPCVFPMIPMTVSYFMKDKKKAKAKLEATVFGISIILIYTIIGTLVAVTLGANFANFLSTHWIPNVLFFLIFLIFAASFFGMFEITLPSWMINKSDQQVDKGGLMGAFFMAFTLVLVSFSCTGPIVGAILVASAGGKVLEPIIGMFGFSLAFALPFSIFAFFPHWLKGLPKSGGWLNSVKVVLGFIELALGLKFLSIADQTYHWGILDREVYLAFWIVIFTLMGFYLLGKLKFSHDSDVPHIGVPRLMLAIVTFTFVVYMIPGMFGAPLKALSGYLPPQTSLDFDINAIVRDNAGPGLQGGGNASNQPNSLCEKPRHGDFLHLPHGLQGYFDYDQGLACAKKMNKPVFIDFTGHGCVNCREMEANVWSAPPVLQRMRDNFVVIALYVDDKTSLPENEWITSKYDGKVKNTIGKKYADLQISRFNVNAQPYYVLLDTDGNLLVPPRAYNLDIDAFVKFLDSGKAEFEKRTRQVISSK